jgi:hypothetical protein
LLPGQDLREAVPSVIRNAFRYVRAVLRRVLIAVAAPDPPSAVYLDEMTKHHDDATKA